MRKLISFAATALLSSFAFAQSPLTTLFAQNNGGAVGWTMYFDLVVNVPVTLTQLDVNLNSGATGSLDVYTVPTTYVGNDTNPGAWTLAGTGAVTFVAVNTPAPCTLSPISLVPGTYGIAVVHNGVGPAYTNGNGTAVPGSGTNQTYATSELTMLNGASAGGGLGTAICCTPRITNCSIHYSIGGGGGTVATRSNYGTGCVQRGSSFYENFATSAAFDLSNSAMTMLNTVTGYTMIPGITTFVAPSGAATALALTDDSQVTVALSSALSTPTGPTTALTVCSNGYVSVASGNGTSFTPVVATFLNAPQTGWWNWHDYNPAIAGSGVVKFEEVAGIAYVTWDGVWDFGGTSAANANTFQYQFDLAGGHVHVVWQTMSTLGNARLVGYSPGGNSVDPGNRDISATLPATFSVGAQDTLPLALVASARPIIGNTINLNTGNIGPTAPFGAVLLSLLQINPGTSLAGLGMAGCFQYQGGEVTLLFLPFGAPAVSTPLLVPNALGIHIYAQSFAYDPAAGLTTLGAIASNGVDLGIGNL